MTGTDSGPRKRPLNSKTDDLCRLIERKTDGFPSVFLYKYLQLVLLVYAGVSDVQELHGAVLQVVYGAYDVHERKVALDLADAAGYVEAAGLV